MKSRFVKTTRWKLPRHRRSRRLPGAEEDRGRWLKCWNCGFLLDTKRGLGAGDGSGIQVTDVGGPTSGELSAFWDEATEVGLLAETPEIFIFTHRKAEAVAGCPFCGTRNLP